MSGREGRRARHRAAVALLACLLPVLAASSPGEHAPAPPVERPSRERELAAIRNEIAALTARLEQLRERESGISGELERLDVELALQARRLDEATAARDVAVGKVADAEAEVERLEGRLAALRSDLRHRLVALYSLGRQGYVRLFLSVQPGADLLPAIRVMRYLARRDGEAIGEFVEARARLASERDELMAERRKVDGWLASEESRRSELVRLHRRQEALLAEARGRRLDLAARTEELSAREHKLASFLDILYGRSPDTLSGTPIQGFRGILDWPVQGQVETPFGPRLDPHYRTQVPHNGLDLATEPGAEVKVIYPGKVLFAAGFEGYGPTVVVHHAGRVFSLYAGLATLRVTSEDVLSLGDVVGVASDKLYFEIRVENRPEDPLTWLR